MDYIELRKCLNLETVYTVCREEGSFVGFLNCT